jgi:predicted nucleic acid-binding protein
MGSSYLGVIFDSSILIEAERLSLNVEKFLISIQSWIGDCETAMCSVSVAELAHGVHRADTVARRDVRRRFLDDLKASVMIYSITVDTAEVIGRVHAEASSRGVRIPFDDLLIGACALERGYAVATHNARHFAKIPGLQLILPESSSSIARPPFTA